MKLTSTLCAAISAFALTTAAFAYPSLLGPTGGAFLPDASVQPHGTVTIALDQYADNSVVDGIGQLQNATTLRAVNGCGRNLEIGAAYTFHGFQQDADVPSNVNEDNISINAKYLLINNPKATSLGVGVVLMNFPNESNLEPLLYNNDLAPIADISQIYGVATFKIADAKGPMPAIRGSIGVNCTEFDYGEDADSESSTRPFASIDLAFPLQQGGRAIRVIGEWQQPDSNIDDNPLESVVVRVPLSKWFHAELGTSNAINGVIGGDTQNLFGGIGLTY